MKKTTITKVCWFKKLNFLFNCLFNDVFFKLGEEEDDDEEDDDEDGGEGGEDDGEDGDDVYFFYNRAFGF